MTNRRWPAVDVQHAGDFDVTLALVDDFSPTAVEERDASVRIFFDSSSQRDAALEALTAAHRTAHSIDVDDEDWARRSQAGLGPVTVGRLTIVPRLPSDGSAPPPGTLVILPSTGFGTGHHATTRLCLKALQTIDLARRSVLDVGTGSGILALASVMLGAGSAIGVDYDADAIRAANENLDLNRRLAGVSFRVADLVVDPFPAADIVTANLTGAALVRSSGRLLALVRPGGTLIVSGLLESERDDVIRAFADPAAAPGATAPAAVRASAAGARPVWEEREEGWVALGMCCN